MLIKLRACTAQSLVVIIFAEFYDDFFLVGWFSTDKLSIASSRKGESTGVGAEDACWLRVLCLAQPEPWRRGPQRVRFSSGRPGSCAEEQREDGPAGSEQRNMNLYLGQDFGKPGCSFC